MAVKVSSRHQAYFTELLGTRYVLTSDDDLQRYGRDWTSAFEPAPSLVLLPGSSEEVARILAYCHSERLAVVPSGGRTGLAGGAVATSGEIVVALARFNRILNLDPVGLSVETQAGVTTQSLQEEALRHGLCFPLDLAAKGSCQIGGNLATNAGGLKFIRFGGTREQVLGLEVVLADGRILDLNTNLRKNNTGYDLKQLFIGSEGTLGIITKATLRLVARPQSSQLACVGLQDPDAILALFRLCQAKSAVISAFEFFAAAAYERVRQCFPHLKAPFAEEYPYYVLLEIEGPRALLPEQMEGLLAAAFEEGAISDGVVAMSSAEHGGLWALRENITESLASLGQVRKNDVAVPIASIAAFIRDVADLVACEPRRDFDIVLFGHVGDGNLHINYVAPRELARAIFQKEARRLEEDVFELVRRYRGSISAEHGIGLLKVDDLIYSRSHAEIAVMTELKALFDPHGILNPGKIFPRA